MEHQELIAIIQEMAFKGKDSYEIEKEIEKNKDKYSDESINLAKREIDDYIVSFQLASQEKSKALNQILLGSVLFLIGIGVTVYTYFWKYKSIHFSLRCNFSGCLDFKRRIQNLPKTNRRINSKKKYFSEIMNSISVRLNEEILF